MPIAAKVVRSIAVVISLASATAPRAEEPGSPTDANPKSLHRLHLLVGPWDGGTIHRESVLFLKAADGRPSSKLLFDAERILAVESANRTKTFEEGRDYQLTPGGSGLILPQGSRIPFLNESELFLPKGSPNSLSHRAGHPETNVLFDNAHAFHDRQLEVSYIPRAPKWDAYRPAFAAKQLGRVIEKLKNRQPVTIAVSGDSISEGYNASEFTKVSPFLPPYPTLVATQLEATYGAKVTLRNFAVGGWSSRQGVDDLPKLLASKPDLVIIAYGMNDVGGRNPKGFRANIETMLRKIHEADAKTEVILVATMTGNSDWVATPAEMFPEYRDALATLQGPGVVLADLTAIWGRLMARKRHIDITGNGVNHPNDYGHRVYAQAILGLLVDPAFVEHKPSSDR